MRHRLFLHAIPIVFLALHVSTALALDAQTVEMWSAPYRNWYYHPELVLPSNPLIPGHESFIEPDVPTVYQLPDDDRWYMSFIAFNGQGYNSFVAESNDLLHWSNPRLAMGFGPEGDFDHGGAVIGAYLYESYDIDAARVLKPREGQYWTLYGAYPFQGGYELRPGYEGVAGSADGLTWQRAQDDPILSVYDPDRGYWEKDCIYQPWLIEHEGVYYNFYNAANGSVEQIGMATSTDLVHWTRHPDNPRLANSNSPSDSRMCADPKVFRDGDHWTMFYFGYDGAHASIMAAFSTNLIDWTASPEPLYVAGGHPDGLDSVHAHKTSLVYNPANDTYYLYYCAEGVAGRGIALLTSKPMPEPNTVILMLTGFAALMFRAWLPRTRLS